MPEYLAPGVFVEETSFRSKSIEGVSTSTTAFVGPTRRGPVNEIPELLTGFADFERIYGGVDDLGNGSTAKTNYLAHAVTAYFNEGGARLYVARAYPLSGTLTEPDPFASSPSVGNPPKATATVIVPATGSGSSAVPAANAGHFQARFPGAAYNGKITVVQRAALSAVDAAKKAIDGSLFRVTVTSGSGSSATTTSTFFTKKGTTFTGASSSDAFPTADAAGTAIELLTLDVIAEDDRGEPLGTYEGLGYHPDHKLYIGWVLAIDQNRRADHLSTSFAFKPVSASITPFQLQKAFEPASGASSKTFTLANGVEPTYTKNDFDAALSIIEGIDDVSIVAAPGHTTIDTAIANSLITHAEKRRSYRIAVLDTPKSLLPTGARDYKAKIDSKYAALYYPWVVAPNPNFDPNNQNTDAEVVLPPSGFLCGIYARSDIERGVHKAPANEVVRSALRFERLVNTGEQEILNPAGVNCLRYFAGRGNRVWGARTTSSDPEWKYVNIRRYFNYLEHSIDSGTQWSVFEANGERLWANIRDTVTGFLFNEWVNGALLGDKPEQAFFVKCDRSTMTQNDLDNGRLICLIGVAAIKPAEFVIFRIGQKTADARS